MRSKADILTAINAAFANVPRPQHFTNYRHCDECADHDNTFRSHSRDSIGLDQLDNWGWDPVCFATVEGYKYYFPAFARLALAGFEDRVTADGVRYRSGYLDLFLLHLARPERTDSFDAVQRAAVLDLLIFLLEEMPDEVEESSTGDSLFDAIERLQRKSEPGGTT